MSVKMKRAVYADMFGPTVGDRVRLADTDLISGLQAPRTRVRPPIKLTYVPCLNSSPVLSTRAVRYAVSIARDRAWVILISRYSCSVRRA